MRKFEEDIAVTKVDLKQATNESEIKVCRYRRTL